MRFLTALGLLTAGIGLLSGCESGPVDQPYLAQRAAFRSYLTHEGPAPQEYQELHSNQDMLLVRYPATPGPLLGVLARPSVDSSRRRPAIVYLHGGFALAQEDVDDCQPFVQAGYVVFAPTYRAENGNPGHFEMFWGEVDDAKAAVRWLARQPYVDSTRIYVFGHSIGAGMSALLSLQKDVPMRFSGGCGGLYGTFFTPWADIAPFDVTSWPEVQLRSLRPNLRWMQYPHYAYLGTEDRFFAADLPMLIKGARGSKLTVQTVPGDHFGSLEPAMHRFLAVIDSSRGAAGR